VGEGVACRRSARRSEEATEGAKVKAGCGEVSA